MQTWGNAARALVFFTLTTGVLYPIAVTVVARIAYPDASGGSLVRRGGVVVGSRLIAQKNEDPAYFWFRPSAGDFATVASSASNLSPASSRFVQIVESRKKTMGSDAPAELLMASGSGLDPHLSPEGALHQIDRVARTRGLGPVQKAVIETLIRAKTEERTFGVLGRRRVNVLLLNLALDEAFPKR